MGIGLFIKNYKDFRNNRIFNKGDSIIKHSLLIKDVEELYDAKELAVSIVNYFNPDIVVKFNTPKLKEYNATGLYNMNFKEIHIATPNRYKGLTKSYSWLYYIHTILHEIGHSIQHTQGMLDRFDKESIILNGTNVIDETFLELDADRFAREYISKIIRRSIKWKR